MGKRRGGRSDGEWMTTGHAGRPRGVEHRGRRSSRFTPPPGTRRRRPPLRVVWRVGRTLGATRAPAAGQKDGAGLEERANGDRGGRRQSLALGREGAARAAAGGDETRGRGGCFSQKCLVKSRPEQKQAGVSRLLDRRAVKRELCEPAVRWKLRESALDGSPLAPRTTSPSSPRERRPEVSAGGTLLFRQRRPRDGAPPKMADNLPSEFDVVVIGTGRRRRGGGGLLCGCCGGDRAGGAELPVFETAQRGGAGQSWRLRAGGGGWGGRGVLGLRVAAEGTCVDSAAPLSRGLAGRSRVASKTLVSRFA